MSEVAYKIETVKTALPEKQTVRATGKFSPLGAEIRLKLKSGQVQRIKLGTAPNPIETQRLRTLIGAAAKDLGKKAATRKVQRGKTWYLYFQMAQK